VILSWFPFATPTVAVVVAATDGQPLAVWGPLGVCLAAVAWFMRELILKTIQDKDRAIASNERLIEQFMTQAVPAMSKSADVIEKRQQLDEKLIALLEDVRRKLG
jgi:hypothetical protein